MTWHGIRRDLDSTGEGASMAINARFYMEGELRRRGGMVRSQTISGVMAGLRFAASDTVVLLILRDNGTLEWVTP